MHARTAMLVRELTIASAALAIAAWSAVTAYKTWFDERNARLVEIGIGVLRVDPEKDTSIAAAREWALNLIDANAGGVRFSKEARDALRKRQFDYYDTVTAEEAHFLTSSPIPPRTPEPQGGSAPK